MTRPECIHLLFPLCPPLGICLSLKESSHRLTERRGWDKRWGNLNKNLVSHSQSSAEMLKRKTEVRAAAWISSASTHLPPAPTGPSLGAPGGHLTAQSPTWFVGQLRSFTFLCLICDRKIGWTCVFLSSFYFDEETHAERKETFSNQARTSLEFGICF